MTASREFVPVPLPAPEDWVAGPSQFPGRIIAGYHAPYNEFTSESWANHILKKCKSFLNGTSTIYFSAINSGSSLKDRFWFGYVFRGGPTTLEDYERDPEPHAKAQGSIAFSLKSLGEENYPVGLQTTLNVFNAEK